MGLNSLAGLGIALFINVFLFLGQISVLEINPNAPVFYDLQNNSLSGFDQGNYTVKQDLTADLPSGQDTPSPDEGGNIFTDVFGAIKKWFLSTPAGKYVTLFVTAVPNALKLTGMPIEISFALGAVWYGYFVFGILMLVFGRS